MRKLDNVYDDAVDAAANKQLFADPVTEEVVGDFSKQSLTPWSLEEPGTLNAEKVPEALFSDASGPHLLLSSALARVGAGMPFTAAEENRSDENKEPCTAEEIAMLADVEFYDAVPQRHWRTHEVLA